MGSKGALIKANQLIKVYRSDGIEVLALNGVCLSVQPGEIVSIMGPSGCGKTTLLNILGGLDKPTAGQVLVNGRDITKVNGKALDTYRLREVGCIFQFFNLIPELTAWENVLLPMRLAKTSELTANLRAKELLSSLGLAGKAGQKPGELSGGEQQRVAVACALANDPSLVLADEPTGELDKETARRVVDMLVHLIRDLKKTSIMVTHDPLVAELADRVLKMENGQIQE